MFINKTNKGLNNICGKNIANFRMTLKISQRELADKMQLVGIDIDKNALTAKYLSDVSFSNNDYILNTLLNLLPQKIYLHLISPVSNLDFINTLQLIFENRIKMCTECNICNLYKSIRQKNNSGLI